MQGGSRLVVCSVAGGAGFGELPESVLSPDRTMISGGERSLYELAVAAATLGMDVELRGAICQPILDRLVAAAGCRPRTGLDSRRPDPADVVVVSETADPQLLTTALLSSARFVMYMLAPPGLWGWSLEPGWATPDPLTIPLDRIGTPATFKAIARSGFTVWTNSHGIAEAGRRAGVAVEWIGTGTPVAFPEPQPKVHDVAVVENNRWASWAEQVVASLGDVDVLRVPAIASTYSLASALAPAHLLIWPSRLEGMSRIAREARGAGTVPVMLDTNPFVIDDDYGDGVVKVPDLESLASEARALLDDPTRLTSLQAVARESAAKQADWGGFVARVGDAIAALPPKSLRADAEVYESLGRSSWQRVRDDRSHALAQLDWLQQHSHRLEGSIEELRVALDSFARDRSAAEEGIRCLQAQLETARSDVIRLSLDLERSGVSRQVIVDELASTRGTLAAAQAELAAYKNRLVIRLVDRLRSGAWRGRFRR